MKEKLLITLKNEEIVQYIQIIAIVLLIVAVCVGMVLFIKKHKRIKPQHFDELEGHEFEYFCAGLL